MTDLPVSVIVLNRDRRESLNLTLAALQQQIYRQFEVILVTNQPDYVDSSVSHAPSKVVPFSPANVAGARNAGISEAGGAIIAFCDDDAVPEPTWLARLVAPFEQPSIGAVGGLVRGRNGVSVQWGAVQFDQMGVDHLMPLPDVSLVQTAGNPLMLKTAGTNCAFRRVAMADVGGFDATYRYFLDETDMNLRLDRAGWDTAFVPGAEVHHGYGASALRSRHRVPKSLFEIGASKAAFVARYGSGGPWMTEFLAAMRRKLLGHHALGRITGRDMERLMTSLCDGIKEGGNREPDCPGIFNRASGIASAFTEGPPKQNVVLKTGLIRLRRTLAEAADRAQDGQIVTVLDSRPSPRMTTVRFVKPGFWHHRGGVWGRIERSDSLICPRGPHGWINREFRRVKSQRGLVAPST